MDEILQKKNNETNANGSFKSFPLLNKFTKIGYFFFSPNFLKL